MNRINFTDSITYKANGNMTCRTEIGITYIQTYNAENHIADVKI